MMPQQLPQDIITDILLGLPAKSLLRFRSACKAWNSLITSHYFIRMHLNHATHGKYNNRHSLILSSCNNSVQFLHYGASNGNVVRLDFPLKVHEEGLRVVGSCNGLLCIVIYNEAIVLWNPSTREYKELPVCSPVRGLDRDSFKFGYGDLYGFGYDFSINDYKVVRIPMGVPSEIYTLKTNSWKKIQHNPYRIGTYSERDAGILVNGAVYWRLVINIGQLVDFNDTHHTQLVLRFDLVDEKFMVVPPPHDLARKPLFTLRAFGGYLGMVQNNRERGVELWALKEDRLNFFWSKLMIIPRMQGLESNNFLAPICFTKNGEVLMNLQRQEAYGWITRQNDFYLYNPGEKTTFKKLLIDTQCIFNWTTETFEETTSIESLISPNDAGTER